jgi:diguanylate cyclase (GGDEF)-like protein
MKMNRTATFFVLVVLSVLAACGTRKDKKYTRISAVVKTIRGGAVSPQPVRITGTVTYIDPEWQLMFIQDESAGLYIRVPTTTRLSPSDRLEITGIPTTAGGIANPQFRVLGKGELPSPRQLTGTEVVNNAAISDWVECTGVVRAGSWRDGRLTLTLEQDGTRFMARVLNWPRIDQVLGAKIQVLGVNGALVDSAGKIIGGQLFVQSVDQITVVDPPAANFASHPTPVATLTKMATGQQVLVSGQVTSIDADGIKIADGSGTAVIVPSSGSRHLGVGEQVNILGFVGKRGIEDAIANSAKFTKPAQDEQRAAEIPKLLRTVKMLKELRPRIAASGIPVSIAGTATFVDLESKVLFVQDATGGAYVDIHDSATTVRAGDRLLVTGVSAPGDFAPVVSRPTIRVVSHGRLPNTSDEFRTNLDISYVDSRLVKVTGVVQSVGKSGAVYLLRLAVGREEYEVALPQSFDEVARAELLVDKQVELEGVCGVIFNTRRQLTGLRFFLQDLGHVKILKAGEKNFFELAPQPIASVMRFAPVGLMLHRTHVRGIVTVQVSNGGFYVQDDSGAVYVSPDDRIVLPPGEVVDVAGFAMLDRSAPYLAHAVVRPSGERKEIAPVEIEIGSDLGQQANAARLSVLEGILVEYFSTPNDENLLVNVGGHYVRAQLQGQSHIDNLRRGSRIRITGVMQTEELRRGADSLKLILRSPVDVRVTHPASWWTTQHSVEVAVATIILSLLSLLSLVIFGYRARHYQATHDSVTGVHNRAAGLDYMQKYLARSARQDESFTLVMVDIDHFKAVNDQYGHLAGDRILKSVAHILVAGVRGYDVVCRYGGDEFLLVLPGCGTEDARQIAERLRMSIESTLSNPQITCSFGVAVEKELYASQDLLLREADLALYAAKEMGRNAVAVGGEDLRAVNSFVSRHQQSR